MMSSYCMIEMDTYIMNILFKPALPVNRAAVILLSKNLLSPLYFFVPLVF